MSSRVFVARMAGLAVFDPTGEQVGRIRDAVAVFRTATEHPQIVGLVLEVPGRRRIFLPITRVVSIDPGQVIVSGTVNLRRFAARPAETTVLGELLDRTVTLRDGSGQAVVTDVAIQPNRSGQWELTRLFVHRLRPGLLLPGMRRRGEALMVDVTGVTDLGVIEHRQGAANLLAAYEGLKAADLAEVVRELPAKRRIEIAHALDDERLADVMEELPEDEQVEIMGQLSVERGADVLESMQPDDAADLLSELPGDRARELISLMDPEEAQDVQRLLRYDDDTAGGLMTTSAVILSPDATVAEALAHVRREEISPAVAAAVFVCRPPLEPPTGRYLGLVHIQRLLREAPSEQVGTVMDKLIEPVPSSARLSRVTRELAIYNLVSLPVTEEGRLVGVVTVDDVLDHTLPDDWRDTGEDLDDVTGEVPHGR